MVAVFFDVRKPKLLMGEKADASEIGRVVELVEREDTTIRVAGSQSMYLAPHEAILRLRVQFRRNYAVTK